MPLEGVFAEVVSDDIAATAAGVLTFVGSLLVLAAIAKLLVVPLFDRLLRTRSIDEHARIPLKKVAWGISMFAAVTVAFGIAGYGDFLVSLTAIAAAATIAIGFALQSVLSNFAAGVFIFVERPFRIGDWIEWDDNAGVVEDISLRVTRVRTFDNELLTVPNGHLANDVVKNPVDGDRLRVKFTFGIGYDDDIDQAVDIIVEEAERHPEIMDDPGPSVRLTDLGDSDIGLQSRVWIPDPGRADFVRIRGEYVQAVKERFDDAGIDIPYPHRELIGGIEVAGGPVAGE